MALYSMENAIQKYDWGDSAYLPALMGRDNPGGEPWAELWMGAHPAAPSRVRAAGTGPELGLDELVASDPVRMLGVRAADRWPGRLPYLLKAMAVARPLSIHAHPAGIKAERGWLREEHLFIPAGAPERNYRDANSKPEIIVALTRFEGLCGFRDLDETLACLKLVAPDSWRSFAGRLASNPGRLELSVFFYTMVSSREARKAEILHAMRARMERILGGGTAGFGSGAACGPVQKSILGRVLMLMDRFPGDIGALAPLVMNQFTLEPGQGLYIAPGEPHAYFSGAAIELEANSDNRVRGGLSRKHLDLPEFLSVLSFDTGRKLPGAAVPGPDGWECWETPAEEFQLSRRDFADGKRAVRTEGRPGLPEILFCNSGLLYVAGSDGVSLELTPGRSLFVPACEGEYSVRGEGSLFRARPGMEAAP